MVWGNPITVTCPECGQQRILKDHGRGVAIHCQSCAIRIARKSNDWLIKHGESKTPLYRVWNQMVCRCTNPTHQSFADYGGRGIRVCNEWQSYVPFRTWALSNGYRKGLLLDRRDNDGNYEPSNCRWVSGYTSAQNRRTTKLNEKIASHIRELRKQGFAAVDLAWAFGVSDSAIWSVTSGKNWYGGERSTIATSK